EVIEHKRGIGRRVERSNDIALLLGGDDFRESGGAHPRNQTFVIRAVAFGPRGDATLELEFGQRAIECEQDVRGRSKPELSVALETAPLRRKVEHDASASRLTFEQIAARNHERTARHTLETLVGARCERFDTLPPDLPLNPAPTPHPL